MPPGPVTLSVDDSSIISDAPASVSGFSVSEVVSLPSEPTISAFQITPDPPGQIIIEGFDDARCPANSRLEVNADYLVRDLYTGESLNTEDLTVVCSHDNSVVEHEVFTITTLDGNPNWRYMEGTNDILIRVLAICSPARPVVTVGEIVSDPPISVTNFFAEVST